NLSHFFLILACLLVISLSSSFVTLPSFAFLDGQKGVVVIGEPNFTTGGSCGLTSFNLCLPNKVVFDSSNNMWVADSSNNRVLKFNFPLKSNQTASLVIGEPDLTTSFCNGATQSNTCNPWGIDFDSKGNLWVADTGYNRILKFLAPFKTGDKASLVLGQTSFSGDACPNQPTQSSLCGPEQVVFDKNGNLWVSD